MNTPENIGGFAGSTSPSLSQREFDEKNWGFEEIGFADRSDYFDGCILPPKPLGAASPPPFTPLRSASLRFSRFQAARKT